jgi:hypothetical protein
VKYYNKGITAHLEAVIKLLDDDHLVFTNVNGVGPIDIVRINIHSGKVELYDAKSDREDRHKKRPYTELQKKLGVQNFYVNLRERTWRLGSKVGKL